ncbi:hypothetical protein CK503_01910 [Aliifodinibius salipaludis]|uniref:Uncharacterized protein n=1 Tax=Fodinibius salipaludis TaxID=2032627 RepID=A0A2A2GFF3_9BACT|nr:hypothetical protein CK503_01910 [Aliifodinibius salipaludis]
MKKVYFLLLSISFTVGGLTHLFHNFAYGFLPYHFAPIWINLYWTMLDGFDLLTAYLLFRKKRSGIVLGTVIISSNVLINSYAYHILKIIDDTIALQLQTLLLGIMVGSAIWLWYKD